MYKTYISKNIYDKIIATEEVKPVSSRTYLYKILQLQPKYVLSGSETKNIQSHNEIVLKAPSSLYVLDIPVAEAEKIQKLYGVMCVSGECLDISMLIDLNDDQTVDKYQTLGNGWDTVFKSIDMLPSNALILSDRYLFKTNNPNNGDGMSNVKTILSELLPKRFVGGEYHVTIIFDNDEKHPSYTFNSIATQLNKMKLQLGREYPIMMEVLGITKDCPIYYDLHNRRIASNYFIVKMEYKLAAFNRNKGTVNQTIIPQQMFTESSLNGHSTPPLKSIQQLTTVLKDFSKSLSNLIDHSVYYYAVNGRCMEKCLTIRNRLIK